MKFDDLPSEPLELAFAAYVAKGGKIQREAVFPAEGKGLGLGKSFAR